MAAISIRLCAVTQSSGSAAQVGAQMARIIREAPCLPRLPGTPIALSIRQ
jgi:hypothetical protein